MKRKLLVVVLILAVLSTFIVMGAQAFGQDKLAGLRGTSVQLVYTDSDVDIAGTAFQVSWWSGIRRFQFHRV